MTTLKSLITDLRVYELYRELAAMALVRRAASRSSGPGRVRVTVGLALIAAGRVLVAGRSRSPMRVRVQGVAR